MTRTPYQQLRQIEASVRGFALEADLDRQSAVARRAFEALRRNVRAAQDTLKDFEMSQAEEDTLMQVRLLPRAIKSLEKLRDSLLKASEYELVGAVDVAQMSAELDELMDSLR